MVVLATGMQPTTSIEKAPAPGVEYDDYGFIVSDTGIHAAGVSKRPMDVGTCLQDSTGAALKALQDTVGR